MVAGADKLCDLLHSGGCWAPEVLHPDQLCQYGSCDSTWACCDGMPRLERTSFISGADFADALVMSWNAQAGEEQLQQALTMSVLL